MNKIEKAISELDADDKKRRDDAIGEGYKDKVCSKCGVVFLAHKHFVICSYEECPMKGKDKWSILEIWMDEIEEKERNKNAISTD